MKPAEIKRRQAYARECAERALRARGYDVLRITAGIFDLMAINPKRARLIRVSQGPASDSETQAVRHFIVAPRVRKEIWEKGEGPIFKEHII